MYNSKIFRKITGFLLAAFLLAAVLPGFKSRAGAYAPLNLGKADTLKALGLFLGSNGDFMLDKTATRAEGAVTLVRLLGKENEAKADNFPHPFKDVPSWANPHTGYLYHYGITNGSSSTTFGSNNLLTAAEFTTFLLRALGYDDKLGDFQWNKSIDTAGSIGLFTPAQAQALKSKTVFLRDDMVGAAYSALTACMKGSNETLLEKLITEGAVDKAAAAACGLYKEDPPAGDHITPATPITPTPSSTPAPSYTPTPSSAPSEPADTGKLLHGFYPAYIQYNTDTAAFIDKLDSVSLAWCKLEYANGLQLNTTKGQNGNYDFYYPADYLKVLEHIKSKAIPAQLSIFGDGMRDLEKLLPDRTIRDQTVNAILKLVTQPIVLGNGETFSFNGVVVDFENMHDTYQGKDRLINGKPISYYDNLFLDALKKGLTASEKKLYAAVQPIKYNDGYEYSHIISTCDKIILMIHDYAPTGNITKSEIMKYIDYDQKGQPVNSLAPMDKIKVNLEYAKSKMSSPEDINKLMLQVSFGTRQWSFKVNGANGWTSLNGSASSTSSSSGLSYSGIKTLVANTDGTASNMEYNYIIGLESPYLTWYNSKNGTFNFLLYEDSGSVEAKVNAARSEGIQGLSLWSLGNIPDYDGTYAADYHLDVWQTILQLFGKSVSRDVSRGQVY